MFEILAICLTLIILAALFRHKSYIEFRWLFLRFIARTRMPEKKRPLRRKRRKKPCPSTHVALSVDQTPVPTLRVVNRLPHFLGVRFDAREEEFGAILRIRMDATASRRNCC